MKTKLSLAAGLIITGLAFPSVTFANQVPGSTFVHLFEWQWNDIATECETFLGPKGFAAVQVSPPQKSVDNPAWWSRYQPVSYSFEGRSGNRQEFQSMVQRCNAAGVDIYLDAVINHMAAGNRSFPEVPFGANDFHTCTSDINYSDRWSIQNCDLVGLNDLKTESEYVRQKIADYMNDAISMGGAGFRIDAAKHIPAADIAAIKSKLNGSPYIFQEVIGAGGEPVQPSEYTYIGDVTEFNFARTIGPRFKQGGINQLQGIGSWSGWLSSENAVTFVTNHDEERHNPGQVLSHQDFGNLYMLGNVFTLAYPYGYPKVMSGYYFNNNFDAGPPPSGVHSGNSCGFDGGNWVCEHKWRGVANMVAFRHHTAAEWRVTNWWDDGYNQIAFGRGGLGFVVINRDDSKAIDQGFQTGMPEGEYCNVIAGDYDAATGICDGPTVAVDSSGWAHFTVTQHDAAAIHVGAKVCAGCSNPTPGPTPVPDSAVSATALCVDNRSGLNHPNLYYWDALPAGSIADASWPGAAMSANGDFFCHDLGVVVDSVKVIFSDNGAQQTDDLIASSGQCYSNGQWRALQDCGFTVNSEDGGNTEPEPVTQSRVCYDNAAGHTQPTLYYWDVVAGEPVADATWPGVVMTHEEGLYCYDFGTDVQSVNLIFSSVGANQSADLATAAPNLCYQSGQWQPLTSCGAVPVAGGDEAWYFRGTPNGWGLTALRYDADTGLYSTVQSFQGEESPARFKIDDGTWTDTYPVSDYQVGDNASYQIDFNSVTKQITVSNSLVGTAHE
ncbi:starch-binding protein [Vibrio sp. ABG19]|uniref:starch-binding protein n=1 Tax=Vibrio sp. ABG19 TaxID=2817385 RepID=UPI00249EABE6|nr:starch-binding protein [Vibrio sp. ABG19]WGY46464.1 starch-binding protein [Vibrio sp. ABG19]